MATHHTRSMQSGFTYAPDDEGVIRRPRYTFSLGDLRGLLQPETPEGGGLRRWYGRVWHKDDPETTLGHVVEDTHWEAGDGMVAIAREQDA